MSEPVNGERLHQLAKEVSRRRFRNGMWAATFGAILAVVLIVIIGLLMLSRLQAQNDRLEEQGELLADQNEALADAAKQRAINSSSQREDLERLVRRIGRGNRQVTN